MTCHWYWAARGVAGAYLEDVIFEDELSYNMYIPMMVASWLERSLTYSCLDMIIDYVCIDE